VLDLGAEGSSTPHQVVYGETPILPSPLRNNNNKEMSEELKALTLGLGYSIYREGY